MLYVLLGWGLLPRVLFNHTRVGPQRESSSIFPSVLDVLAAKDHGDDAPVQLRVREEDSEAGTCCGGDACLDSSKAWEIKQLVRVVPRLRVLDVLGL